MRISTAVGLISLAAVTSVAESQTFSRQFQITPRGGYIRYDDASAIKDAGAVGVDAMYNFTRMFSVGAGLMVSRTVTEGSNFISQLRFGDTTFLFAVQQPLSILDASVNATARFPVGRFSPFVTGGVGSYKIYMDPQANAAPRQFSRMAFQLGGGINIGLGRRSGLILEVRDLIYTDFDRRRLNPNTSAALLNSRFNEDVPKVSESKTSLNNLVFSLGFSFSPGAGVEGNDGDNR